MHFKRLLKHFMLALFLLLPGCASLQQSKNMQVKVSAPEDVQFSAKYNFGNFSGSMSTIARAQGHQTILDIPQAEGYLEISKEGPSILTVAIFEGKRERFSFRSSTNTAAFKIVRDSTGWNSEVTK